MISMVVKVKKLSSKSTQSEDLAYWLTQTPEQRIETVEILREQFHGSAARLQRVAKVFKRTSGRIKDKADLEALNNLNGL